MDIIEISAPAKLNLTLDIVGICENSYHKMDMIMQTVDLCDELTIKKTKTGGVIATCEGLQIESDKNIATRAGQAFFEAIRINGNVQISIKKKIPHGAGMGGGSADGAAVLVALNSLFSANLSVEQLMEIGAKVGADIPFLIKKGTARVEGFGEVVTPIKKLPKCYFVVAKPVAIINTKDAFLEYDKKTITKHPDTQSAITAIENGDLIKATGYFLNVFEEVISSQEISDIKTVMRMCGGLSPIMTGSGSAIFTTFLTEEDALNCYFKLSEFKINVYVCTPCS